MDRLTPPVFGVSAGDFPKAGTAEFWIDINAAAVVELTATCSVLAAAPNEPSTACTTVADPVWRFDQEAFDAEWGPASFPLDEYVGFAYAESAVPEPGQAALLAVGALVLAATRRAWGSLR